MTVRPLWRWGLAFVAADFLTGTVAFVVIIFGAIGLAFYTGMSRGLTSLAIGGPIEAFVAVEIAVTLWLAVRGYRWILGFARNPSARPHATA
jgi:hypothetical protein